MSVSCVNENVLNANESNNDSLYGFPILDRVESAIVLREWPKSFLSEKIVCSLAPRAEWSAKDEWDGGGRWGWQRVDMDVAKLRTAFADPVINERKGGNIFAPCELTGGARNKKNVRAIYAMTFDVDNGQTEEDLIHRLEEFGACYITYTSHSNGKTSDMIPLKKLRGFDPEFSDNPTDDDIRRFLVAPRHKAGSGNEGVGMGYWPSFAATAKVDSLVTDDSGETIGVKITHYPISKLRIVLPLAQPFVIDGENRSGSENVWKAAYVHIANKIGVSYDHSCTDVTRGFYAARTKALDNYRSVIGGTTPFVLPEVTPEMMREAGVAGRSSRAKSHKANDLPRVEGEPDFEDFLWRYGSEFDVSGYLDALGWEMKGAGDLFRKSTIECPNDDAHTSAHWPNDTGCVAMPPDVADSGKATITCQHDGCKQREYGTADYLRMIWQRQNAALADGGDPLPAPEEFVFEVVEEEAGDTGIAEAAQALAKEVGETSSQSSTPPAPKKRFVEMHTLLNKARESKGPLSRYALKGNGADARIVTLNKDDEEVTICRAFEVLGSARSHGKTGWGLLIAFYDDDNHRHELLIDMSELEESAGKVRAQLVYEGFKIFAHSRTGYFETLLKNLTPSKRVLTVSKPGWVNDRLYIAPNGDGHGEEASGETVRFENPPIADASAGTLEAQLEAFEIALTHGSAHHLVGILAGCAGVLVDFVKLDSNPVLALTGASSAGKTTALYLAGSAFGKAAVTKGDDKTLIHSLRGTPNAMEALAEAANGSFFGLDETKLFEGDIQALIFSIAIGSGKGRLNQVADLKKTKGWRTFTMLTSERGISELVETASKRAAAVGMTARLADLDVTNARKIPHDEYLRMTSLLKANYGHIGPLFVDHLLASGETPEFILANINEHVRELVGEDSSSLIQRSAYVFGLLWEVGAIMTEAGLLPEGIGGSERIREMWSEYMSSAEAEALSPEQKAITTLRETLFAKRGNGVYQMDDEQRYAEALAWYREENVKKGEVLVTFYVRNDKLADLAGGTLKQRALGTALKKVGIAVPASNGTTHGRLPNGAPVTHYKLAFTIEPEAPPAF
jgi:hypothetical protein